MWFVPNQFECIKDEDKRLKFISENLLTTHNQVFKPPSFHPVEVWLNNQHEWVKFINVANELNGYIKTIKSGLSFKHEAQKVMDDKYEDLPFLSQSSLNGIYIHISMEEWDQDIKCESLKFQKRKRWSTPLASDWHWYRMSKPLQKSSWGDVEARNVGTLPVSLHWYTQLYNTHQVNPRWVEQLMGLPIGWTDPYL